MVLLARAASGAGRARRTTAGSWGPEENQVTSRCRAAAVAHLTETARRSLARSGPESSWLQPASMPDAWVGECCLGTRRSLFSIDTSRPGLASALQRGGQGSGGEGEAGDAHWSLGYSTANDTCPCWASDARAVMSLLAVAPLVRRRRRRRLCRLVVVGGEQRARNWRGTSLSKNSTRDAIRSESRLGLMEFVHS